MSEKERKSLGLLQLKESVQFESSDLDLSIIEETKEEEGSEGSESFVCKEEEESCRCRMWFSIPSISLLQKTTETKKKTRRNNKKKLLMKQMKEMNGHTDSTPAAPEATEHPIDVQENSAN